MKLKLKVLALAVMASTAGTASAQLTLNAAGASATRQTIRDAIVGSICGASGISIYENGANVRRIDCPTAAYGQLVFNYDNTTGSFQGIGPVSGNGDLSRRVNIGSCTTGPTPTTIAGKTVQLSTGCGNEGTLVRPNLGNADVEPALFTGINLPAGSSAPTADISATGQFGVVFGIIVSRPLYVALQKDQGLTSGDTANPALAPTLSTAQIRSIGTANGGPLNTDWRSLFRTWDYTANSSPVLDATENALARGLVNWRRRVAGSGSQAAFNAFFTNNPCAGAAAAVPSTAGDSTGTYNVNEQGSTGGVITQVSVPGQFAAGLISRETNPTAGGDFGFVRLDGVYPNKANAQNGTYNWVVEQVLTKNSITDSRPNELAFFNQLATLTGSPSVIAGLSGTQGIVALPFIADSTDPQYNAQKTRYRTLANTCGGLVSVENP